MSIVTLTKVAKSAMEYGRARFQMEDNKAWDATMVMLLVAIVVLMPNMSWASDGGTLSGTICNIVKTLQGPVARGVAAFGIIFLGFSLFLGKISWGTALALGIGIGAIFGADQIVAAMAGDDGRTCSDLGEQGNV